MTRERGKGQRHGWGRDDDEVVMENALKPG